ncbi:MAG: 50S ribosomal protein L11 methyltransferase [Candidatus Kryptoniota bacterium]
MSEKYIQLKISANKDVNDLVVGLLSDVGAEGFVEESSGLSCYFAERKWKPSLEKDTTKFLERLKAEGKIDSFSIDVTTVQNQDWNVQWEESVVPVEVTKNVAIKPSWKDYNGTAKIVIEIDPKMSFGTGHHETTRMMVQLLEKFVKGGENILDIGTGTGVLAIAAVKLGAGSCTAIDNDNWSIENARENIENNDAADKINLMKGEIASAVQNEFDIVVANLNRNTLLYMNLEIYKRCKKGGILLVAGVLTLDEEGIVQNYRQIGFDLVEAIHEGDWAALAFKK